MRFRQWYESDAIVPPAQAAGRVARREDELGAIIVVGWTWCQTCTDSRRTLLRLLRRSIVLRTCGNAMLPSLQLALDMWGVWDLGRARPAVCAVYFGAWRGATLTGPQLGSSSRDPMAHSLDLQYGSPVLPSQSTDLCAMSCSSGSYLL